MRYQLHLEWQKHFLLVLLHEAPYSLFLCAKHIYNDLHSIKLFLKVYLLQPPINQQNQTNCGQWTRSVKHNEIYSDFIVNLYSIEYILSDQVTFRRTLLREPKHWTQNGREQYLFALEWKYVSIMEYCTSSLEECIDDKTYKWVNNKLLGHQSCNELLSVHRTNVLRQSPVMMYVWFDCYTKSYY